MVSIGMIGAGRWGSNWVRTLAALPGVELRYVCDVSESSLARVKSQYPQVRTTTQAADLCDDPTLSAVVIATAAPTHYDVARQALLAGKDVMVEKPMTLRTEDAAELTDLAKARGRVLMVGHLLEYHPAVLYIKDMIDSGELGDVYYIYSQRLNLGTVRQDENAWWSLAPHDISVACRLLGGAPLSVQCRGQNVVQQNIADVVFATLEFGRGRIAHMHVSWLDPHKTRKLTVVGSKRMVVFDDMQPSYKVTVYDESFSVKDNVQSYADWITLHQGDIVIPKISSQEPLKCEASHFVDCVRTRKTPVSDGESGTSVVSVLEYGDISMEQGGKVVQLPKRLAMPVRKAA